MPDELGCSLGCRDRAIHWWFVEVEFRHECEWDIGELSCWWMRGGRDGRTGWAVSDES